MSLFVPRHAYLWWATVLLLSCASEQEQSLRRQLEQPSAVGDRLGTVPQRPPSSVALGPSVPSAMPLTSYGAYLAFAVSHNSELRAAFQQWRASVYRISQARSLPDLSVTFGVFVRSVETRVGPQVARVGVRQVFPWPSQLSAAADAQAAQSQALQQQLDAKVLSLNAQVAQAYWALWQVRQTQAIHQQHLELIRGLSEAVLARVATGSATLADQQQVDLTFARVQDWIDALGERSRAQSARLRALLGAAPELELPTPDAPPPTLLPIESEATLQDALTSHPSIESLAWMVRSDEERARREEALAYPSFSLGVDWTIVTEGTQATMPEAGKDAVFVGGGVTLPLFRQTTDGASGFRAEATAKQALAEAAVERARGELGATLSAVRDAARRAELYRSTLVPQAESAYESVLGSSMTGRASTASVLLAQKDLLDIKVDLIRARAEHARAWAQLEAIVGRPVAAAAAATAPSQ